MCRSQVFAAACSSPQKYVDFDTIWFDFECSWQFKATTTRESLKLEFLQQLEENIWI